jgi:hypothetical protein
VKVSAGTCEDLAGSLRRRHERAGKRWRLLGPLAQAVLVIAFLRTNLTCAELAAGFGISPATCWRNVREGVGTLADRGRRISLSDVARLAAKMGWDYVIVDGMHVPAETFGRKTGGQRAFYSGKHKRHGLNVQTVCSPDGELLWAAAPLPGATVDVTAARKAGIAGMLTSVIGVLADLGYLGWDEQVVTGRRKPRGKELTAAQRAANRLQGQLRCVGERGNARLKYWKVLAIRNGAPPWSRPSWPCTTWSTTRSPPSAPRSQARSLPGRNPGTTAAAAVSGNHSKSAPDQGKEPRPGLSNQGITCVNPG